jgi:hypothetical protein
MMNMFSLLNQGPSKSEFKKRILRHSSYRGRSAGPCIEVDEKSTAVSIRPRVQKIGALQKKIEGD